MKAIVTSVSWLLILSVMLIIGCGEKVEISAKPVADKEIVLPPAMTRLDFREVVQSAKAKVFPAVVFIKCIRESHESGKKISQEVVGSGVLISPDGELLTNWHVVDKATEIRCLLYDGRYYTAKPVGEKGTDKDTDLALIKLEMPEDADPVPFATLGDSESLKEGDFVMAMGAPWGLSRSVSIGIISCTRRFLPSNSEYSLWLQTDASISPGNSGGPLVNTAGEIIGINTRGSFIGGDMGFAIPATTIGRVVEQLRTHGKMNWSWTGLQLQALKDFNRNVYFDAETGVIVAETDPESPARRAGLKARDRIISVNGQPLTATTEEDLPMVRTYIGLLAKEQPAEIEFVRDGEIMKVTLTPREKGKVEGEEFDCPRWDMTVKAINQFDNPQLYFHRKKGVFVYGVKYPGNAQNARLSEQDIILKIEGEKVETLDGLKNIHANAIENVETKHKMLVTVLRNGLMRQLILDFSRDYEKE